MHGRGSFVEVVEEAVTAGSCEALEEGLAQEWNALGRELIQQDAEAMDERLRDQAAERPGWVIVRRNDVKELLTPFGPVRYGSRFFRNGVTAHVVIRPTIGWG